MVMHLLNEIHISTILRVSGVDGTEKLHRGIGTLWRIDAGHHRIAILSEEALT